MSLVGRWWRQADQYEWLSSYLQARGFAVPARRFMALVAMSGVLVPANALWSPAAINHAVFLVLGIVAGTAGVGYAVLWLRRWPSRSQSIGFAVIICGSSAMGSCTASDPAIALTSCAALAVSGGYLAFFHSAKLVAANLVIALSVAAIHAARLAGEGNQVEAWSLYFLVFELNVGVPLAIQIVVHALGFDLIQTDRDPLTGLLNRRSFARSVVATVLGGHHGGHYLAFAMVDLDRFKALNDALGHSAGDDALVAVGRALDRNTPESALVGRVGGEEFLVADIVGIPIPYELGRQAKDAVASTSYHLTGSVGTASVSMKSINAANVEEVLHRLTAQADVAMYAAKRVGGNRVQHHALLAATNAGDPPDAPR